MQYGARDHTVGVSLHGLLDDTTPYVMHIDDSFRFRLHASERLACPSTSAYWPVLVQLMIYGDSMGIRRSLHLSSSLTEWKFDSASDINTDNDVADVPDSVSVCIGEIGLKRRVADKISGVDRYWTSNSSIRYEHRPRRDSFTQI